MTRQQMEEEWLEAYFHVRDREIALAAIPLGLELSASLHRGEVPGGCEIGAKRYVGGRFREVVQGLVTETEKEC